MAMSPWLPTVRRRGSGPLVVCLPPAGAGAGFFREWETALPGWTLQPVQLPGREERFTEGAHENADALARDIATAIHAAGWDEVALLGVSYGALLGFLTARHLEAMAGAPALRGLVACARGAPQGEPRDSVADLPEDELVAYVRSLGGLPPEIDEHPELLALMLPVLRADFRANDQLGCPPDWQIAAPIQAVAGSDDPAMAGEKGAAWETRTTGAFTLEEVAGGHFFMRENPATGFHAIAKALSATYRRAEGAVQAAGSAW